MAVVLIWIFSVIVGTSLGAIAHEMAGMLFQEGFFLTRLGKLVLIIVFILGIASCTGKVFSVKIL